MLPESTAHRQPAGLRQFLFSDRAAGFSLLAVIAFWGFLAAPVFTPAQAFHFWFYQFDAFWLPVAALAFWVGARRFAAPEERRFWRFWSAGLLFWTLARMIAVYWGEANWPNALDFLTDVLYVLEYLAFLLAMIGRPYLNPGWTIKNPTYLAESVSRVILVIGILSYFIIFPERLVWTPTGPREPSFYMFCILDILLLLGAIIGYQRARGKWKILYACLLWLTSIWLLSDTLDLLLALGTLGRVRPGSAFDLAWRLLWICQIPFLVVMLRLQSLGPDPTPTGDGQIVAGRDPVERIRRFLIVASILTLPTIHLLLYSLGLLSEERRNSRALAALVFMLLAGAAAFVYQELLERGRERAMNRFRALFDQEPVMVALVRGTDDQLVVEDCNVLFAQTTGYSKGEIVGSSLIRFTEEASAPAVRRTLQRSRQGEVTEQECRLHTRSGIRVPTLLRAGPLALEWGRSSQILVTWTDLSEQRRLQEMLLHSQKMESVGRLAGGVAHDFNNSLAVIIAHAEMLLADPTLGPEHREQITEIMEGGQRAASLTRQLLAFSRKTPLEPADVDVNETVQTVQKMLKPVLGGTILVRCELQEALPKIHLDPHQLESSLLNLAINSRDAMQQGGTLTLRTGLSPHRSEGGKREVEITVIDTGIGMDEVTRDRIFEPFFTTKAPGKGTGLGLSTVFGFVQQSKGTIQVESRPGTGTRFRLTFPVCD